MNLDTQLHIGLAAQVAATELARAKHAELLHQAGRPILTEESPAPATTTLPFRLAYLVRHYAYRLAPRLASRLVL